MSSFFHDMPAHVRMVIDGAEVLVPHANALAFIKDGYTQAATKAATKASVRETQRQSHNAEN